MNSAPITIVILAGLVILSVCDAPCPSKPTTPKPPVCHTDCGCKSQYVAARGETQWTVAARYAGALEKHLWLRQMRRASYLATDDDHLYPGQVLCVEW